MQAANKKLVGFERGFISEEGIKEREWYRHLGVAPGKWLGQFFSPIYIEAGLELMRLYLIGYGATTFPALTESLTIEKNVTLAQEEAKSAVVNVKVHLGPSDGTPGFALGAEIEVEGIKDEELVKAAHEVSSRLL